MRLRHAAALALVVLSACATSSLMNGWVGKPESQLLAAWGKPDKDAALAGGGKVDTWVRTDWLHDCEKTFTIDPKGTIVGWSDSDCPIWNDTPPVKPGPALPN